MATGIKKTRASRTDRFGELAKQVVSGTNGRLTQSELVQSIGFLLRLANGVSQERVGGKLEALGLRVSLYSVMLIIQENPGLNQQEIGRTLSIQQPNLVALVNELNERGLIRREVNAEDRRSYSLALTPAGERLLAQANEAHLENERKLAAAIAPMKLEEFQSALKRILAL